MRSILCAVLICAGSVLAQTPIKHRFLAVDNGANKLLLVDQIGGKGWTVAIPAGSRDLQWLTGGKVLVSHGNGAAEYDLATGAKGWTVDGYADITTARRLGNGNTLLGGNTGGVTLYEVTPAKTRKSTLNLPAWSDLRLARRLENGNTLLGLAAGHKIAEIDPGGKSVWTGALTDKGYVAYRLANGHTIAASGEDCLIYDFSEDGKAIVIAGGLEKHAGKGFLWFSGFEPLAEGHLLVANWNGHGKQGQGPHAVEFDARNNLVWSWEDHAAAATVTNVMTVEGNGPVAARPSRSLVTRRIPKAGPHDALGRAKETRHGL